MSNVTDRYHAAYFTLGQVFTAMEVISERFHNFVILSKDYPSVFMGDTIMYTYCSLYIPANDYLV